MATLRLTSVATPCRAAQDHRQDRASAAAGPASKHPVLHRLITERLAPGRGRAAAAHSSSSSSSRAAVRAGAASSEASTVGAAQQPIEEAEFRFCCPICLDTVLTVGQAGRWRGSRLACERCARTFEDTGVYADLTVTSGAPPRVYRQSLARSVELFRNPLVSFVYERGWRQGFASAGFPGPDEELRAALQYLSPVLGDGAATLLDLSCGSGLFTRRFLKSGAFARVIAADYSENMLRQTQQFIAEDPTIDPTTYCLVRLDVARLPFRTGQLQAIHAGAAIHCWPDPQAAMAEISRVLAPGGVFVGTTFMGTLAPLGQILGEDTVRPFSQALDPLMDPRRASGMRAWEETELRELAASVGLVDFQRQRDSRYIMFSARKPGGGAGDGRGGSGGDGGADAA